MNRKSIAHLAEMEKARASPRKSIESRDHNESRDLNCRQLHASIECWITAQYLIKVHIPFVLIGKLHSFRTPGGIILWSRSFTPAAEQLAASSASPVNSLIRDVLIEGRAAENNYEKDGYAIKWSFVNDLELIFVVRH